MTVSGVDATRLLQLSGSRSRPEKGDSDFGQFLEKELVQNADSDIGANTSSENEWSEKAGLSEGVTMYTAPDGTEWTHYDIGAILTDHDKMVLGWPISPDDEQRGMIAGMVAMDRADGTLTGAISTDYILGNKLKGIVGLLERWPSGVMDSATLSDILSYL